VGFYKPARNYCRAIYLGISLIIANVARPTVSLAAPPVTIAPYTLTTLTKLVPPAGATRREHLDKRSVRRLLRLDFLSPRISVRSEACRFVRRSYPLNGPYEGCPSRITAN